MPTLPPTHRTAEVPTLRARTRLAPSRRGYGRAWQHMRLAHLRAHPLCQDCQERGLVTAAECVDHVDGDVANNDPSNHRSLCWPCHSKKTARQDGGFGNARQS